MTQPVRLAINGATGRMGQALLALVKDDPRFHLVAAIASPSSSKLGQPVDAREGAVSFTHEWPAAGSLDVVVDFSGPAGLAEALTYCESNSVALVTGTTGLDATFAQRLTASATRIALLRAANFSLGVAVLTRHPESLVRGRPKGAPAQDLQPSSSH